MTLQMRTYIVMLLRQVNEVHLRVEADSELGIPVRAEEDPQ
jgi:hypothetical protein